MKHRVNTVCIIGTGLIGGSISYAMQENEFCKRIIGVEKSKVHAMKAVELGIVSEVLPMAKAVVQSDLVILAIPVKEIMQMLPKVMQLVTHQTVIDVGSTKADIVTQANQCPASKQFIPTHPMWGTERSGPDAAEKIAFKGKAVVICNQNVVDEKSLVLVADMYKMLGMHIVHMDAHEHDIHTAYVSHISHLTSFALANTVLHKETKESTILNLASGGFESTVRLAKSNPAMWVPIFLQNKKNILDVVMELEIQIAEFKKALINEDEESMKNLIQNANKIKKILK